MARHPGEDSSAGLVGGAVLASPAPVLERARIAVVVPAFDEERWIAETVARMPAFVDHVIVVDDASRDGTAREAAAPAGAAEVVRHTENRGVGAAIVTGYRRALALGADVVAVMAGDGQMHPDDLARVALPLVHGEADYVKGDRLAHPGVLSRHAARAPSGHGRARLAHPSRRRPGAPLGQPVRLHRHLCARARRSRADLDALWPRYGYPNDLLGAVARRGLRVREVVVRPVYRGEASGLRPWHLVSIGYVIGRVAYRRLRAGAAAVDFGQGRDDVVVQSGETDQLQRVSVSCRAQRSPLILHALPDWRGRRERRGASRERRRTPEGTAEKSTTASPASLEPDREFGYCLGD